MTFMPGKPIDGKEREGFLRSETPCPNCKQDGTHFYKIWDSSDGAFEDEHHYCFACEHQWWIDGVDS